MRKIMGFIIICVLSSIVLFKYITKKEEIRVRIIPSSNCPIDLEVKEEVKKLTIGYLDMCYDCDINKYKDNIKKDIKTFETLIKPYNACVSFKKHTFYNKTYNGNSIKDKNVLTFLVTIKEAKGDNWWGVIYPQFLGIESTQKNEYRSFFVSKTKQLIKEING